MFVDLERAFSNFEILRKEVDRAFNHRHPLASSSPLINIYENEQEVQLVAQVPGFSLEALDITFVDGVLQLKGEAPTVTDESQTALRLERHQKGFEKAYRIPVEVNVEGIEARLSDGLLTIILPKAEKAIPQKIEIKA